MCDGISIELPGGFWLDGVCHREAVLRPISGSDEVFLREAGESLSQAHKTSNLLSRCLTHIGLLKSVTPDVVRKITVGDREALLLQLRRLTLGEQMQCELNCPEPNCGEMMDVNLTVSELLMRPYQQPKDKYMKTFSENGSSYRVTFRLPSGADQEAVADLACDDPRAASHVLLNRCVERVEVDGDDSQPLDKLPSTVARYLPAILAELDPQAEIQLNLTCPNCKHDFATVFDTATYLFQEIEGQMKFLFQDVHLLAYYYHWSEAEILGMTSRRRKRYLRLLSQALTQEEHK